jgi:hypothetical protein
MIAARWPDFVLGLLSLPLWFGPPFYLLFVMTRTRVVRIAFGAGLAAALLPLYAIAFDLLSGSGLPVAVEAWVLWGPTTVAVCGAAWSVDQWLAGRRGSGGEPESGATGSGSVGRRKLGAWLAAAFVGFSACFGGCVFSPMASSELRTDAPGQGLVLPLPTNLTLVSSDQDCGSEMCSETFLVGSPDQASLPELTSRLWDHLVGRKGWDRTRDNAGCQRRGWFSRNEFVVIVDVERTAPAAVLKVFLTGALACSGPKTA